MGSRRPSDAQEFPRGRSLPSRRATRWGLGRCRSAGGDLTMWPAGGNDPHGWPRLTAATHLAATTGLGAEAELEPARGPRKPGRRQFRLVPAVHTDLVDGRRPLDWLSRSLLGRSLRPYRDRAAHWWRPGAAQACPHSHSHPATRTAPPLERSSDAKPPPCSPRRRRRSSRWERACAPRSLRLRRVRRRPPRWRLPWWRPARRPLVATPGPAPLTTAGPRRGACARTPPRRRPRRSAR